eukprot:6740967-Karenia_brevis.AAC.1
MSCPDTEHTKSGSHSEHEGGMERLQSLMLEQMVALDRTRLSSIPALEEETPVLLPAQVQILARLRSLSSQCQL